MRTRSSNFPSVCLRALLVALACSLAAPCLAQGAEPSAADKSEAKKAYTEARAKTKAGDHAGALPLYRRAHDLAPTPVTRLDLAQSLAAQGKLLEARKLASTVSELPISKTETDKSKAARKDAVAAAAAWDKRLARVTLTFEPAAGETEVAIDGSLVSKELLTLPLELDPGEHVVVARRGERSVERKLSLAEQASETVKLEFPEEPPPPAPDPPKPIVAPPVERPEPKPPQPAPVRESEGLHASVPALFTISGVGFATGIVTGAVALSQVSDLEAGCPAERCPPSQHGLLAAHQALTITSTVGFVLGGAAAGAGAIAWIVDATSEGTPKVAARWLGTGLALEGAW